MNSIVVIPVFNEQESIQKLVTEIVEFADVCIVDDASTDQTGKIVCKLSETYLDRVFVITHQVNTHIPKAIKDGLIFASKKNYDFVVTMDAGFSHDPADLKKMLSYGPCDLLIGTRKILYDVPLYRRLISKIGSKLINYCLSKNLLDFKGPQIIDCTSGFRRYSKKACDLISRSDLTSKAFDFHIEALALVFLNGLWIRELEIEYRFTNSSFNPRVLSLAAQFAFKLWVQKIKSRLLH